VGKSRPLPLSTSGAGDKTARSAVALTRRERENAVGTDRLQPFDHELKSGKLVAEIRDEPPHRIRALVGAVDL
jgi:hypothetical protein